MSRGRLARMDSRRVPLSGRRLDGTPCSDDRGRSGKRRRADFRVEHGGPVPALVMAGRRRHPDHDAGRNGVENYERRADGRHAAHHRPVVFDAMRPGIVGGARAPQSRLIDLMERPRLETAHPLRTPMIQARLVVDAKTLRAGSVSPATGAVWIAWDGVAFPSEGWDDFVVVILDAWASALLNLLRSRSEREEVHFMEGPYSVDVTRASESVFQVCAIERRRGLHASVAADARILVQSVIAAVESVLAACRAAHIGSAEVDRLSAALPLLRREVMRLDSA